jgi:hypothetical protein
LRRAQCLRGIVFNKAVELVSPIASHRLSVFAGAYESARCTDGDAPSAGSCPSWRVRPLPAPPSTLHRPDAGEVIVRPAPLAMLMIRLPGAPQRQGRPLAQIESAAHVDGKDGVPLIRCDRVSRGCPRPGHLPRCSQECQ